MRGPDFTRSGAPVIWGDQAPLDDHFHRVIDTAVETPGLDILACDWSVDDLDSDQLGRWWANQAIAIRRELATRLSPGMKATVRRRLDKSDGLHKCYVRVNRTRPKMAVAS